MDKIIVSPFIGDFRTEVMYFLPFVNWLAESFDEVYISSHTNRKFLYKNVNFNNVNLYLSRTEPKQLGWMHKDILLKDYKNIEDVCYKQILEEFSLPRSETLKISLGYSKRSHNNILYHQKKFDMFDIDYIPNKKNQILFIPDNIENITLLSNIYVLLQNKFNNVKLTGDTKIHLLEHNENIHDVRYFSNGYINIIKDILDSKFVICPVGQWTYICNLFGVDCFSWGKYISQFKENGLYYFNNRKSFSFCFDKKDNLHYFEKMLDFYIEKNCLEK